jgi:hypothetical protein
MRADSKKYPKTTLKTRAMCIFHNLNLRHNSSLEVLISNPVEGSQPPIVALQDGHYIGDSDR